MARHAALVDSRLIPVVISGVKAPLERIEVFDNGVEVAVRETVHGSLPIALTILVHLDNHHSQDWVATKDVVLDALPRFNVEDRPLVTINLPWMPPFFQLHGGLWHRARRKFWNAADWTLARATFRSARRVMVVISDGDHHELRPEWNDNVEDRVSGDDFVRRVQDEHATLYVIRIGRGGLPRQLRAVATESGGVVVNIDKVGQLPIELSRIADEVASQVVLYFAPAKLDGRLHRLSLRSNNRELPVRSRQSYRSPQAQ